MATKLSEKVAGFNIQAVYVMLQQQQQFISTLGLQSPLLVQNLSFEFCQESFIQILNVILNFFSKCARVITGAQLQALHLLL